MIKSYKEKKLNFEKVFLKKLTVTFSKDTPLLIMKKFIENNFYLPEYYGYTNEDKELFALGITELLHNSIRASYEKDSKHPITCDVKYIPDEVNIMITNGAGGFDFSKIIFHKDKTLDMMSEESNEYHKKTKRGGFGLYLASKIFNSMDIKFLNFEKNIIEYEEDEVFGTQITLKVNKKGE